MGKLIDSLRQLIKEELAEMARPSFSLKILDKDKAERIKKLHAGHWVAEMIGLIIDAGEEGTSRAKIADILDRNPKSLQNELKALQDNKIVSRDVPTVEKPEKEPGQRGRKPSDKSREGVVRILFQKWQENPDYTPTEEEITYDIPKGLGTEKLTPEMVAKIKSKALGLTKRGRPAGSKDDLLSKVEKNLQAESLSEIYRKLQKV